MEARKSQPRWARWRRTTTALLALLLAAWFTHFAYLRITTPPGRAPDDTRELVAYFHPPMENDATDELYQALTKIPSPARFNEPPPPGMRWDYGSGLTAPHSTDFDDMLLGPWDPPARPILRHWIRQVSSPAAESVVEKLRALRGRPCSFIAPIDAIPGGLPWGAMTSLRSGTRLLVAHARYEREELKDPAGAWEDLKSAFLLAKSPKRESVMGALVRSACLALTAHELRLWTREEPISESIAADMHATLQALAESDTTWPAVVAGDLETCLDAIARCFTDDGAAGGWAVLNRQTMDRFWAMSGKTSVERSSLWNLLSPLYNDRRTVQTRVIARHRAVSEACQLPYVAAVKYLLDLDAHPSYEPADGPYFDSQGRIGNHWSLTYQNLARTDARIRALRIMIALNRYAAEQSLYPAQLEELAPRYIDRLPPDPFADAAFVYRLTDADDYLLYSRGPNGVDDNGQAAYRATFELLVAGSDDVFTLPRTKSWVVEPVAVPIGATGAASSPSKPGRQLRGPRVPGLGSAPAWRSRPSGDWP